MVTTYRRCRHGWLWVAKRTTGVLFAILLACNLSVAQESASPPAQSDRDTVVERSLQHMRQFDMRLVDGTDAAVPLLERALLTYGDSARSNENGTVWAFGKEGRPLAIVEVYQGVKAGDRWVHAITLTGNQGVSMKTPDGSAWQPQKLQIELARLEGVAPPAASEARRLRQMKEIARRFTAYEFWDPDNSRFELRLLVQPIHRYRAVGLVEGAAFVLAHGTNPEVILLIEALGPRPETARWHYSLARLGSAELHVELDGREVWKRERTPGIVGQPTDPYWLFLIPVDETK